MTPGVRGKIKPLEMEDDSYTYQGYVMQWNSEFKPLFNHYLLRQHELGIIKRLDRYYSDPKNEDFEMIEPVPLDVTNVMFPFSVLGASIIISICIATVEKLIKMSNAYKTKKTKVRFAPHHA